MTQYNPEVPPDPAEWLDLDEQERIELAEAHHRTAHVKVPAFKLHAVIHVVVENQIAEGLESVVRAMARLANEGLSRHDAIHAVGAVCAEHLFEIVKSKNQETAATAQARYDAAVERLTAKSWRQDYGQ